MCKMRVHLLLFLNAWNILQDLGSAATSSTEPPSHTIELTDQAYVEQSVYYKPSGLGRSVFQSPRQETFTSDEVFLLLLGGTSDQTGSWTDRLQCPAIKLTIDSLGLWFGGTLTVHSHEQEFGVCTVTLSNEFLLETFDFGLGNYSSCVAMFNMSAPGVYFVDSVCTLPTLTTTQSLIDPSTSETNPNSTVSSLATSQPTSPSAFETYRCPERRTSCLNGVSLLESRFKDPSNPMISYTSQLLMLRTTGSWAQTLVPGFYVVVLEVEINGIQSLTYDEDYVYVRIILPELVANIKGATIRESSGNDVLIFNASRSHDPVGGSAIITDAIYTTWTVLSVLDLSYYERINCAASFPECRLLESDSVIWHNVSDPNTSKYLYIETSLFPNNSTVFVIFTISRGLRVASAIQSLYISTVVRPLNLSCLYNCPVSANDKIAHDKIELDLSEEGLGATYTWSALRLENNSFVKDTDLTAKLAVYERTVSVPKGDIIEGITYLFNVLSTVTVNGQIYQSRAGYIRTVNYIPYGGSCKMDKTKGDATVERFLVECSGWLDEGERIYRDPSRDTNPVLTYAIIQKTTDAFIEEETIMLSDSKRMLVYLKPGDRYDDDRTNITVQIIDRFGDAATVTFTIQSVPTIDVTSITADDDGAQSVLDYMTGVQETIANRKSYNFDAVLSIVTSAAEQLLQIPLPKKPSEVAKTLDGQEGVLLDIDLSDSNSSRSITFQEYYETSISSELDPATYQIQQGFEYLAYLTYNILLGTVVHGSRGSNQRFLSQLTQCFNNLIAVREYVNTVTKSYVVASLHILSEASGTVWVEKEGLSAEEEQAENALVDMTASTVNSVVPNDINELRIVDDMESARNQIGDMVKIQGENMTSAISEALISPAERAYLYLKVQEKLKYDLENVKDLARSSAASIVNVSRNILAKADVCLSCSKTIGTGWNRQKLVSMTSSDLGSTTLKLNTASVRLNSLASGGNAVQKVLMMQMQKNIFMYDSDSTSSQIAHGVIHLELGDNSQVIDTVTYEQTVDHTIDETIYPVIHEDDVSKFSLHKFIYRNTIDDLCLRLEPCEDVVQQYNLYIRFSEPPTILDYDIKTTVSSSSMWIACIKSTMMKSHTGMNYLGVETKFKNYVRSFFSKEERAVFPCYDFSLVTVSCLNWEEESETWRNDKCKLEWKPDRDKVICVCHEIRHLTFGTSFFIAPNTIDFSTAFLKFSPLNQAAVLASLAVIFVIYVLVVIWARRGDVRDLYIWGIKSLVDNFPSDNYFFIIKVYTGFRLRSGTESKIAFRLSGDRHDTGVRILSDGIRKRFEKGSVMQFLMSTHMSLGVLTHIRIWHDNRGEGELASWYLSKIVIIDLQDNFSYTFLCEDWIAVEKADESMDKLLYVTNNEYLQSFNHRLTVRTKERLIDGHLWTSILYRPTFSNFTRVQRATCAYMALMITMLANAMYFNPQENYETPTSIVIGPFRFSLHQVLVAFICAAISTVPTLVAITVFNKSKRRIPDFHDSDSTTDEPQILTSDDPEDDIPASKSLLNRLLSVFQSCCRQKYTELSDKEYTFRTGATTSNSQLPYWCSYVGWFIAIGSVLISSFIILVYSMEWGKQKSEEWLSTFLLSMLQSVILIDPIMIVAMAFCFALIFKTLTNDSGSKTYSGVSNMAVPVRNKAETLYTEPPLGQADLEVAKRKRSTEVRKRITAIEIVSNLFLLWLLLSVSYSNRDDRTYRLHETILNMMNRVTSKPFKTINSTGGFYKWLQHSALPAILPVTDFNGDALHWTDQQYISDLSNFRVGPPRLRQLRVKTEPCNLPLIEKDTCHRDYSYWSKETGSYCLRWREPPCRLEETVYNHSSNSWKHSSADPFSGVPLFGYMSSYENGGYKADLDISRNISELIINELFASTWIDRKTRSVILEFTVYCANVNVFAFSMFMVEFPETGGALPSFSIFPVRIYHHVGPVGTYVLICEVSALIYFIYVFIRLGLEIFEHKCKFYKQFWILFDIGTAIIFIHVVVFYAIRLLTSSTTITRFQEDKRLYVDFYQVVFYDKMFVVFLGILVFLSTVRCLRILEGNKHVYIVANIFYKIANDLFWLMVMLVFVFVVFAILGCLLFGSRILSFMNMYKALATLFLTVIGKSKFTEINESDPILAKIYYSFFVFGVSLLMMSVFLSSLSACIGESSQGQTNVDDVFLMAIERVLRLLRGKPPEKRPATAKTESDMDTFTIYSMNDTSIISDLTLEDLDDTAESDYRSNTAGKFWVNANETSGKDSGTYVLRDI